MRGAVSTNGHLNQSVPYIAYICESKNIFVIDSVSLLALQSEVAGCVIYYVLFSLV